MKTVAEVFCLVDSDTCFNIVLCWGYFALNSIRLCSVALKLCIQHLLKFVFNCLDLITWKAGNADFFVFSFSNFLGSHYRMLPSYLNYQQSISPWSYCFLTLATDCTGFAPGKYLWEMMKRAMHTDDGWWWCVRCWWPDGQASAGETFIVSLTNVTEML